MIIKPWPLDPSCYIPGAFAKKRICWHHTVGGTAKSTLEYWNSQANTISTSHIIDRDGTIYETYDYKKNWSYHLGLGVKECIIPDGFSLIKGQFDKETLGVELASEGPLKMGPDGKLYKFDKVGNKNAVYVDKYVKLSEPFRGERFFDDYEPAMIQALIELTEKTFQENPGIARNILIIKDTVPLSFMKNFSGIVTHYQFRTTKTDIHVGFDFSPIIKALKLQAWSITGPVIGDLKPAPAQLIKVTT